MITLTFSCGGCDKVEPGTTWLQRKRVVTMEGQAGSWGYRVEPKAEDVAPEGWISFDPYTQCTYCPECWAGIEEGSSDE